MPKVITGSPLGLSVAGPTLEPLGVKAGSVVVAAATGVLIQLLWLGMAGVGSPQRMLPPVSGGNCPYKPVILEFTYVGLLVRVR